MVKDPRSAILKYSENGPTFGNGWDIYISDNANSNRESYCIPEAYETPKEAQEPTTIFSGTKYFSPDDWEVFSLD